MHVTKCWNTLAGIGLALVCMAIGLPRAMGQTTSAAPVIAAIPDQDTTVNNASNKNLPAGFSITIANAPTRVIAIGTPSSVGFNDTVFRFLWGDQTITPGVFDVTVTASNDSGSHSRSFRWVVHPSMFNFIHPDKSSYTVGDTITLTANYQVPVVVTGSPYIELWPGKNAVYASGSGTSDLRFQATVTASDITHMGLVANVITAGGGGIATRDGASANLQGPRSPNFVGGTAPSFNVVVSSSTPGGPTITSIAPPPAGLYGPNHGATIDLTVNFNGRVNVKGSPSIGVRIGSVDREFHAGVVTGGGTAIVFSYGFGVGDSMNDNGTLRITGPIRLNGGTIQGDGGADASLSFTAQDVPSVVFDATPPSPPGVSRVTPATPTPEQSFTLAGTAEAGGSVLFRETARVTHNAQVDAAGNWSQTFPPRAAGTYTFFVQAQDRNFNRSTEIPVTVTVRPAATPPTAPVPVVSEATVAGQVGVAITPVQVAATNSPTSFSAPGLAAYGLTIDASGAITGTPTAAAEGITIPVTATNAAGTSGPGVLTLNLAAPPTSPPPVVIAPPPPAEPPPAVIIPPPPTTLPPPGTTPPATLPPPTPALASQTITFNSPVSGFVINFPVTLGATSSAGLPVTYTLVSGNATLEADVLTPRGPGAIVVRASQAGSDTVAPASVDVDFGRPQRAAQTLALAPATEVMSDGTLNLSATSSAGLPVTFQIVSGAATVQGNVLVPTDASGTVTVRAVQAGNDSYAPAELSRTIAIIPASRLVNLSSRAVVREGDTARALIAGFVVAGAAPKQILVRAAGPALRAFGVADTAANPRLRVFDQAGRVVGENDDWSGPGTAAAFARLGAFNLAAGSADAALLLTLAPGAYSLHVETAGGQGTVLAEVYDASERPALEKQQLINLSTRAFVDRGDGVLTAGFVVTGATPKRVLVRGIGPGLTAFGVQGALSDPEVTVYRDTTLIARNDDWQAPRPLIPGQPVESAAAVAAASSAAGAFALTAPGKDAALVIALAPGAYTAVVSGVNDSTGAAMVEVYQVP